MYIVDVSGGKYTSKGSFFATNKNGQEFYANKQVVERNKDVFLSLSQRKRQLWILIQDTVWGGKWGNKNVKEIITISVNKNECEEYKNNLIYRQQLRTSIRKLHEQKMKLIKDLYGKPSYAEEEMKLENEESMLTGQLRDLNSKLDDI